jgi:hypothetical protein
LRRLGRIGIGLIAGVAGFVTLVVLSVASVRITGVWHWQPVGLVALLATIGVFSLFERMHLVPDDSEPPTSLSLKDYKNPDA